VTEGGALAIYAVRDGKLVKLAQTPAHRPHQPMDQPG